MSVTFDQLTTNESYMEENNLEPGDRAITVKRAAELLGVGTSTINRRIRDGMLTPLTPKNEALERPKAYLLSYNQVMALKNPDKKETGSN